MSVTITSIVPASAQPGAIVTITGTGFGPDSAVFFGSSPDPEPLVISATQIQAQVPEGWTGSATAVAVKVTSGGVQSLGFTFTVAAAPAVEASPLLASLTHFKQFLGLPLDPSPEDPLFRFLLQFASVQIWKEIGKDVGLQSHDERYDGDGTSRLDLLHGPVVTLSSLSIDGQPYDLSTVAVYPDYIQFIDLGEYNARLRANSYVFSAGNQNVAVSYVSGYVKIPADIPGACCQQAVFLRNTGNKQGVLNETNPQANLTSAFAQLPLAPNVQRVCNRYQKTRIAAI